MATMQSFLEKDKERFISEIAAQRSSEEIIKKADAELSRILFLYNENEDSERVKAAAYSIIQSLRASVSLLDSVKEAKLYSYTALKEKQDKGKVSPRLWIFLGIGLGCTAAAVILLLMSVRAAQLVINLPLFAVLMAAALLCIFFAGMSAHRKKKETNGEITAEIEYDADKIYRHLYSGIIMTDRMLEDVRAQDRIEKRQMTENEKAGVDDREIALLGQLLEDAYADRSSEFSSEIISHIKYYLHNRNIDVLDDAEGDRSWFDVLPGEGGMVRPAIVMDNTVLKKGLVSGGRV